MPNNPDIKDTGRIQHLPETGGELDDRKPSRSYDPLLDRTEGQNKTVRHGHKRRPEQPGQDWANLDPDVDRLPHDEGLDPDLQG